MAHNTQLAGYAINNGLVLISDKNHISTISNASNVNYNRDGLLVYFNGCSFHHK